MSELKPCPFCGAQAHLWKWNGGVRIDCSRWCGNDENTHFVGIGARTEQKAIEAWNRRAELEQPHGEWIVYPLIDEGRAELECPKCGEAYIRAVEHKPHFCENCGADMRGKMNRMRIT